LLSDDTRAKKEINDLKWEGFHGKWGRTHLLSDDIRGKKKTQ
jgi:hypothetical protein